MAQAGTIATKKAQAMLASDSGVRAALSVIADLDGIEIPPFQSHQVIAQNVAPEIIERSQANRYPTLHVYCSKIENLLTEKFRTFSGQASMLVEVRVSQDRLEGVESQTQWYADAVTRVLDENRGDWGEGAFYGGGYEVTYGPVKHGGRNFLQTSKVSFTVEIGID